MTQGYAGHVLEFLQLAEDELLGRLVRANVDSGFQSHRSSQVVGWREQIRILKEQLSHEMFQDWFIVLEYELPRRSRRPDVILLAGDCIFVVEFKVGATSHEAGDRWQAYSYALDLRDFHEESRGRTIIPILCATESTVEPPEGPTFRGHPTRVADLLCVSSKDLGQVFRSASDMSNEEIADPISPTRWVASRYRPTPTIVEAAVQLYQGHGVREISHRHAHNLDRTTEMLIRLIEEARRNERRIICFVTGIPGAGKTLTGLNVVHDFESSSDGAAAGIFLSGNGPLVKVIRKALVMSRTDGRRRDREREVTTFIQNVHQFLRYYKENPNSLPHEHVVVFDEAQRAWDEVQMKRKHGIDSSEPELLFEVMERLPSWCVIVALVGGGQEIFLGEAGLEEWGRAIAARTTFWEVVASSEVLSGGESVAGHRLFPDGVPNHVHFREETLAHLDVGVRSHRARRWTEWVNDLLNLRIEDARRKFPDPREFPCVVTRDLDRARAWLRAHAGDEPYQRMGLVATSKDQRLRAHGLETSSAFQRNFPFDDWFLTPSEDIRSSFMLEVAASEFECQGLELDWVGVCWGGDLTPNEDSSAWVYRKFRGSVWRNVRQDTERSYTRNRYRVLLTRARRGTVIWVPPGSLEDPTRDPRPFDRLYAVLRSAGMPELEESFS